MDCPIATKVWFGSQLNINTQAIPTINFQDWLSHMIITAEEDITVYIASIIYGLWFAHNKKVFEDKDITEDVIISTAWKVIQDFKQTKSINYSPDTSFHQHQTGNNNRTHNHNNQTRWTKPRTGLIKINCDANLQRDGIWGLGAAYRDDEGQILAAATWQTPGFNDPVTAEVMAIYNAMHVAIDCCFRSVVMESDCAAEHRSVLGGFNFYGSRIVRPDSFGYIVKLIFWTTSAKISVEVKFHHGN
ncbi:two-component response regulator ARR10 [Trifolium repens]|nr:two-component response regulator ARR10 [Trifolium repens]